MGSPHGKQHLRAAADAGQSDMEQDSHADAFVERLVERDESAVDGNLIHASPNLSPVLEQHQREDGAAEFDARSSLSLMRYGGHSLPILHQVRVTGQITKVRGSGCAPISVVGVTGDYTNCAFALAKFLVLMEWLATGRELLVTPANPACTPTVLLNFEPFLLARLMLRFSKLRCPCFAIGVR